MAYGRDSEADQTDRFFGLTTECLRFFNASVYCAVSVSLGEVQLLACSLALPSGSFCAFGMEAGVYCQDDRICGCQMIQQPENAFTLYNIEQREGCLPGTLSLPSQRGNSYHAEMTHGMAMSQQINTGR